MDDLIRLVWLLPWLSGLVPFWYNANVELSPVELTKAQLELARSGRLSSIVTLHAAGNSYRFPGDTINISRTGDLIIARNSARGMTATYASYDSLLEYENGAEVETYVRDARGQCVKLITRRNGKILRTSDFSTTTNGTSRILREKVIFSDHVVNEASVWYFGDHQPYPDSVIQTNLMGGEKTYTWLRFDSLNRLTRVEYSSTRFALLDSLSYSGDRLAHVSGWAINQRWPHPEFVYELSLTDSSADLYHKHSDVVSLLHYAFDRSSNELTVTSQPPSEPYIHTQEFAPGAELLVRDSWSARGKTTTDEISYR